ncbi:MAG: ATP-binding protein [Motiliproteus sp.]
MLGLLKPLLHHPWVRPNSLIARLRLASCLLLPLIMGVTSVILEQAFSRSLEAATQERLRLQTYVLLGAAEAGGGTLWMPAVLQEPRFGQPGSGLYGLVSSDSGELLWRSASTLGLTIAAPENGKEQQFGRTPSGLFFYSYPVVWETEDGKETPFTFISIEVPTFYQAELSAFRIHLWAGLGLLAILLLAAQGVILRWGMNPLAEMAKDLKDIEQGNSDQLSGDYPQEVSAITTNLNLLLEAEQRQRERYRNTLADLAHSLKTPLAVLRNETNDNPNQMLTEQVDRMDQIISHQLGRATTTSAHHLLKPVSIQAAAKRIGSALEKIYRDKFQGFDTVGPDLQFKGDERDLMEILGNLLDNAFKYGNGLVRVSIAENLGFLTISVEDNGNGISAEISEVIQQRGTRADSISAGQGIGLAVVRDILAGYKGKLHIDCSELGGACFRVCLPVS